MKLHRAIITSLLALVLAAPAMAEKAAANTDVLADPIVSLMPSFNALREELKLNEEQSKTVDTWIASAPQKYKELEQEALAARVELSEALLTRASRFDREQLKFKYSEANRRLIEMKSLCVRMLNNTLTEEQYNKVVAHYKESAK